MGLHIVGNPRDYGGDDNPPEHGRDTMVYQDLQPIMAKYKKWLHDNEKEFFNDSIKARAHRVLDCMEEVSDQLNVPL